MISGANVLEAWKVGAVNMAIIVQLTLAEMVPIVLKDLTKPFANVLAIMKVCIK